MQAPDEDGGAAVVGERADPGEEVQAQSAGAHLQPSANALSGADALEWSSRDY